MRSRPLVVVASALLAAAAAAPYAWHHARPPAGTRFTGAVFYRDDYYQYLSFAEQAAGGALVFRNKFDVAAHPAALVNLEWWTAGVLGRLLGGPAAGLEALRLISIVALVAAVSRALALGGLQGRHHAAALALVLAAGGSGWLLVWAGVPGWQVADVAIGFYPFHQALTNGHFVAGAALLLWSVVLLAEWRAGRRGSAAWVAAAWALGLTRPYDLATFALVAASLCALDLARAPDRGVAVRRALRLAWLLPPFAYYALLIGAHPSFRGWGGHGLDLSPPRYAYLLALIPVGALLVAAVALPRRGSSPLPSPIREALGCWLVALALLVAAVDSPLARQCVVSAGLVTLLLAALTMPSRWLPWATLAAAPTSVFLLWRMFNPWPESFAPVEYFEATDRLRAACAPYDVAIAPTDLSLMIAGLTPCSVAFGHRTLTPRFQERLREGDRFYHDPAVAAPWRRAYLDAVGARFVALPAGGGPMLGPEPPFRPILANAALEVWERTPAAAAKPAAGSDGTMRP